MPFFFTRRGDFDPPSGRNCRQRALGFFIRSNGGGVPYRMRIKGPSFVSLAILPDIVPGTYLADIPAILGSLDFVMGECDR